MWHTKRAQDRFSDGKAKRYENPADGRGYVTVGPYVIPLSRLTTNCYICVQWRPANAATLARAPAEARHSSAVHSIIRLSPKGIKGEEVGERERGKKRAGKICDGKIGRRNFPPKFRHAKVYTSSSAFARHSRHGAIRYDEAASANAEGAKIYRLSFMRMSVKTIRKRRSSREEKSSRSSGGIRLCGTRLLVAIW